MRRRGRRRRLALLGLAALFAATVAYVADATDALRRIELETVDLRFAVRGERDPAARRRRGRHRRQDFSAPSIAWPFKRGLHAGVIDELVADGAKVIGYDISSPRSTGTAPGRAASRWRWSRAPPAGARHDRGRRRRQHERARRDALVEETGGRIGNTIMSLPTPGRLPARPLGVQGLALSAAAMAGLVRGRPVARARRTAAR